MLKSLKLVPKPEEAFTQRYQRLRNWALRLTDGDREQAEDLLHDLFVQFTFSHPALSRVDNLDAYLRTMMRNMHLSLVRRATRMRDSTLSIADYDSAEIGLRIIAQSTQKQTEEDLRLVCHYACVRKESSKAGSVLILRFFHGYHPSEIARVLHSNRRAVDEWLRIARREAKLYLADPSALAFMVGVANEEREPLNSAEDKPDLLTELRWTIWQSRHRACLLTKQLKEIYQAKDAETITSGLLAHVVSCEQCLEQVNKLLGLAPLADRYPTDKLGPDQHDGDDRGGDDGGSEDGGGGTADGSDANFARRSRRRATEVFEHKPQELRIAVNGFVIGSQKVSSERSELSLSINLPEQIGFVEVFSEQWVRLMFFYVDQARDANSVEQRESVNFSDGRSLDVALNFKDPWPTLNAVYYDPELASESGVRSLESEAQVENRGSSPTVREGLGVEVQSPKSNVQRPFAKDGLWTRVRRRWADFGHGTWDLSMFLRPGIVTVIVALMLIAALVLLRGRNPIHPLSAKDLLQQSAASEEMLAGHADQVIHRTIDLEERRVAQPPNESGGELIAHRRVEVWQSAEKGVTARRLFDEKGQLIAGDWRRADGVQTLYQHGARPQLQFAPERRSGSTLVGFDNVWQLSPSAKEFSSQIGSGDTAHVEETATSYVISYAAATSNAPGIVRATLALSRADLHATELTLLVLGEEPIRRSTIGGPHFHEFHFTEISFERRPASAVAPAVFEPEPELLKSDGVKGRRGETEIMPPSPAASAALEVEVLRLLSQIAADLGQEVTVKRELAGALHIEAIVESQKRKTEILSALTTVANKPAVKIQIETAEEARKRILAFRKGRETPTTNEISNAPAVANTIPAREDVRRYLLSRGSSPERIEEDIQRFSGGVLNRSNRALLHAWALKSLVNRFSAEELRTLDPKARADWLSMIRAHALACQRELAILSQEIAPVFSTLSGVEQDEIEITDDASLTRAITRLVEVVQANDAAVQSSFTISVEAMSSPPVKSSQFWRSLKSAERLAAEISRQ